MKRHILVALTLLTASLNTTAKDITPQQAQQIAARYITLDNRNNAPARSFSISTTATTPATMPYYAFNDADGNGFVLVSGDDCVTPVLGYSTTGAFDENNMPMQMREWLQSVTAQIAAKRTEGNGTARTLAPLDPNPTVIVPALISSTWDQSYPYNRKTPTIGDRGTLTGCVATASAQVMRYHRWPKKGMGSVSYKTPNYDQKSISIDFTQSEYDWDNMRDTYNIYSQDWSTKQADAVSVLMRDIGAACHLQYNTNGTSGFSNDAAIALMRNFGYNAEFYYKSDYSTATWMSMIKEQLDAGMPIIYSGVGLKSGGHEFVVDGYDSNGYLHVNWGWSGVGDGFFALSNFGDHNYCLYTDAVFAEPDLKATTGSDFQSPLWAAFDFGRAMKPMTSYTTKISDVGYLEIYLNIECGSNIIEFDGLLRVVLKDSKENIVAIIDKDNCRLTKDVSGFIYKLDPDTFTPLADGTYQVEVESTYNRNDGTPFGEWKHAMIDANRIFVKKTGDELTFTRRAKHDAPITVESLEISPDPLDKLQINSLMNIDLQLNSDGDDSLGKTVALTLKSTDNPNAEPTNIILGEVAVFENMPYVFTYSVRAVAANGILPGNYTASVSTYDKDEGYTDITPDGKRCRLTIENNPSNYYSATVGDLLMRWSSGETIETSAGKTTNIDMNRDGYATIDASIYFLAPLDYESSTSQPAAFSSVVKLVTEADGKEIELRKWTFADCKGRSVTSYISRAMLESVEDVNLFNRELTLRFMKTVPYSNDFVPMQLAEGGEAAMKVRFTDGTAGIENLHGEATVVSRYDTLGRRINAPQKGINIVKLSDGRTVKVVENK